MSNVNELKMLRLNNSLPLTFHPKFNRNDGGVVYVHEFSQYGKVRTRSTLCDEITEATNEINNVC